MTTSFPCQVCNVLPLLESSIFHRRLCECVMDVAARTEYLKDINGLRLRCHSKLESLVAAISWDFESLNRNIPESAGVPVDADHDEVSKATHEEGPNQQLVDFEKRYNDLISGLPVHQRKGQEKSEAEALAELLEFERNTKRRRISYKNRVHTKNKSQTEVLRELVREQMEVLKEMSVEGVQDQPVEKRVENEEDSVGLIQLNFTRGNPHKMWMNIGQMVENREEEPTRGFDVSHGSSRHYPKKRLKERDEGSWRCHDDRDEPRTKRKDSFGGSRSHSKEYRHRPQPSRR